MKVTELFSLGANEIKNRLPMATAAKFSTQKIEGKSGKSLLAACISRYNCRIIPIAAIIMICDSSEAAIRAMDKPDGERVDKLLRSIIHDRINRGQFDKCPISLMDLDIIRRTIVRSYGGLFHKRVK